MTLHCACCDLPRRHLDAYGTCRRCRFAIWLVTGHPLPRDEGGAPWPDPTSRPTG